MRSFESRSRDVDVPVRTGAGVFSIALLFVSGAAGFHSLETRDITPGILALFFLSMAFLLGAMSATGRAQQKHFRVE